MPKIKPPVDASTVKFIKLGAKGAWEKDCIEGKHPSIRLGFRSKQHVQCLAGNWPAVHHYWATTGGKTKGKASEFTSQVRTFYTADEKTLWITFYKRMLHWCVASAKVEELPDGTRIRKAIGSWSSRDINGNTLHIDNLSGLLTKVQGFRGTICSVEHADYLVRRINGKALPEVEEAATLLGQLEEAMIALIPKLGWKDFELLCDLIFTKAGWQRISSLGKTQKSVDLELLSPVTGKRAFVQVKSQSDLKTFLRYKTEFESMAQYDEMYFVVHTPSEELGRHPCDSRIILLTSNRLAKLVVSAGLSKWLIRKVS